MFAIKLIWLECPETMGRKSFAYEQGRERETNKIAFEGCFILFAKGHIP
jgi:hypothetical protein